MYWSFPHHQIVKKSENYPPQMKKSAGWKDIGEYPGFKTGFEKNRAKKSTTLWYTSPPWDTYHKIPLPTCGGSVAWFRARRVLVAKNGGDPGLRWE